MAKANNLPEGPCKQCDGAYAAGWADCIDAVIEEWQRAGNEETFFERLNALGTVKEDDDD